MKYYTENNTCVHASVQLLPANETKVIAAQQQFGWHLDHTFFYKTVEGTLEFAVLVRILDGELQPILPAT